MVVRFVGKVVKGDKSSYDKKLKELNWRIENARGKAVIDIMRAETYEEAVRAKEDFRRELDGICEEVKNARKAYKGIPQRFLTEVVEEREEPALKRKPLKRDKLSVPSRQFLYTLGLLGMLLASVGVNVYQAFTVAGLQRELTDKTTIIDELTSLTENQNHTIDLLSKNLTEANSRIMELEEQLAETYSTISSLEKEFSETQALTSVLIDKLEAANETISTLQVELEEAYARNIMLEKQLNTAYKEISELNETIESLYATFNYNLTAKPSKLTAYLDSYASTTITVEWLGGPSQPVNLTLEWTDENITAEITPISGTPTPEQPLTASLTVYVKPQAALKTYYITVVAISQYGLEKTMTISVVVKERELPPVVG